MSTKTKNGIIATVAILAIAGGIYFFAFGKKKLTKEDMVKFIAEKDKDVDPLILITYDDDYVQARYQAVKDMKPTFMVKGQAYTTADGRAVVGNPATGKNAIMAQNGVQPGLWY